MRRLWNGGPVWDRELGRPAKLWFVSWDVGITLGRDADGVWHRLEWGMDSDYAAYTFLLRGGYRKIVPEAYYDELVAAGYGNYFIDLDEYTQTMLPEYED